MMNPHEYFTFFSATVIQYGLTLQGFAPNFRIFVALCAL